MDCMYLEYDLEYKYLEFTLGESGTNREEFYKKETSRRNVTDAIR